MSSHSQKINFRGSELIKYKPVNFVWLERKVMEWGCMQALIDFDGWRKWKDYSQEGAENESNKKHTAPKSKTRKNKSSLSSSTT